MIPIVPVITPVIRSSPGDARACRPHGDQESKEHRRAHAGKDPVQRGIGRQERVDDLMTGELHRQRMQKVRHRTGLGRQGVEVDLLSLETLLQPLLQGTDVERRGAGRAE